MVNELRVIVLTFLACFSVMLTGISYAKVETTPQRDAPITIGENAPDFTLEDQNARKITLAEWRGKSPVVLVFYRGYW